MSQSGCISAAKAAALLLSLGGLLRADQFIHRFEGDRVPHDPFYGWLLTNPCVPPCSESVADGHFVLTWDHGGVVVRYTYFIAVPPTPVPESLWVEFRFRSSQLFPFTIGSCDGSMFTEFRSFGENMQVYADAVVSGSADHYVIGLDPAEFHTYRLESPDGSRLRLAVDGQVFKDILDLSEHSDISLVQFHGQGCNDGSTVSTNEWDYLRFGTLSYGEHLISTDPPAGAVDPFVYPALDRFTVTFDGPHFPYVDDITVTVLDPPGASVPEVLMTRRRDNGAPETVEIVLDRSLAPGSTTRFTFDDGSASNIVEYTLGTPGVCCSAAVCSEADESTCYDLFVAGATCTNPEPCCIPSGACQLLDPVCCTAQSGSVMGSPGPCEGDADGDGVDAICGDECPADPLKLSPGRCGCGLSDITDSDADTILDCFDECPGVDDLLFARGCTTAIPTASHWGLAVITLALLSAAKVAFGLRRGTSK